MTVATLFTHGSDFFLIFRNAALSVFVFGVLGYLWGILYERITEAPLIESYRMEAVKKAEELKQKGKNRVAMAINVDELTPGMKCLEAVYSEEGAHLVRQGAVLTDRMISILKENNIQQITVEAIQSIQTD
ncbi:MAG: hypothetical protein JXR73_07535 [Candidatus Omnitrophica bacterium]|nr:hypothetical protein [Candidatus Omnitrophota bacterium]